MGYSTFQDEIRKHTHLHYRFISLRSSENVNERNGNTYEEKAVGDQTVKFTGGHIEHLFQPYYFLMILHSFKENYEF